MQIEIWLGVVPDVACPKKNLLFASLIISEFQSSPTTKGQAGSFSFEHHTHGLESEDIKMFHGELIWFRPIFEYRKTLALLVIPSPRSK